MMMGGNFRFCVLVSFMDIGLATAVTLLSDLMGLAFWVVLAKDEVRSDEEDGSFEG